MNTKHFFWTSVAVILCSVFIAASEVNAEVYDRVTPVVKAVQKTKGVVVNIAGKRLVSGQMGYDWSDPFGFFGPRHKEQITVLGSGVVVHEDGYVITNAHVVQDTEQIKVTFSDASEHDAKVISADPSKDIAFLKIDSDKKFPFIHLGRSDDLLIGETVIAIGNPFGYSNSVSSGVVSAVGRDIEVYQGFWLRGLIQTDAAINRGNSGGPLLNINGELIGITTAIKPDAQNIGFAIPIDAIADNLTQMLMPEKLRRVKLGLMMGRMKTIGKASGLEVASVVKDSPAQKQGIAAGDVIVAVDGKKVTGFLDFFIKMIKKEVGQPISLEYVRPGDANTAKMKTAKLEMAPRPLPDGKKLVEEFFQMEVQELNRENAQRFGFEETYPVMIVTGIDQEGAAATQGMSVGDLILEINGSSVASAKELSQVMETISQGDTVQFKVLQIKRRGMMQIQRQYEIQIKAQPKKEGGSIKKPAPKAPAVRGPAI